jgi:hypothetical protein
MERGNKFKVNNDWQISMSIRVLYLVAMVVLLSLMIFIPGPLSDIGSWHLTTYLKWLFILGGGSLLMLNAIKRIRSKESQGPDLIIDYALVVFGGLAFACFVGNILLPFWG